jgi:hypothetical protein
MPYLLSRPLAIIPLPPAETLEADCEHRGSEEALIDLRMALPADEEPAKIAQPGEAPLHRIATSIVLFAGDQRSPSPDSPCCWASLGRNAHLDAQTTQDVAERCTIISADGDDFLGALFGPSSWTSNCDRIQVPFGQPNPATCALSRWNPNGSPSPSTQSIHLAPFPFRVRPTFSPLFLADANEPWRKAMDQSS